MSGGEEQRSRPRNPSGIRGQGQVSSTTLGHSAEHCRLLEGKGFSIVPDVSFFVEQAQ